VSLLAPVRFALLRLRAHAQRTVVVALGIAIAAALLAMTSVGSVAVQDRAAQQAIGGLQPSDRAVQAVWSGVPGQSDLSLPALDRLARSALRPVLHQEPFAVGVFRQATWVARKFVADRDDRLLVAAAGGVVDRHVVAAGRPIDRACASTGQVDGPLATGGGDRQRAVVLADWEPGRIWLRRRKRAARRQDRPAD
jgi:hypothetical protein